MLKVIAGIILGVTAALALLFILFLAWIKQRRISSEAVSNNPYEHFERSMVARERRRTVIGSIAVVFLVGLLVLSIFSLYRGTIRWLSTDFEGVVLVKDKRRSGDAAVGEPYRYHLLIGTLTREPFWITIGEEDFETVIVGNYILKEKGNYSFQVLKQSQIGEELTKHYIGWKQTGTAKGADDLLDWLEIPESEREGFWRNEASRAIGASEKLYPEGESPVPLRGVTPYEILW